MFQVFPSSVFKNAFAGIFESTFPQGKVWVTSSILHPYYNTLILKMKVGRFLRTI